MTHILLGFDARAVPEPTLALFRERFLLRADVPSVLTVDSSIWPSIVVNPPQWIGANHPFWEDLENLRAHTTPSYWLIAAAWHKTPFTQPEGRPYVGPHESPTKPESIDPAWRFLGYDIADPSTSGLSNCGYTDEELIALRPLWAPHLNECHLFDDLDKAIEFRELTGARVPEHAPFFVIGLWLIETS